jgi:beta-glucosidase
MVLGHYRAYPKEGQAAKKYEDLKKGLVGSMLNVKG